MVADDTFSTVWPGSEFNGSSALCNRTNWEFYAGVSNYSGLFRPAVRTGVHPLGLLTVTSRAAQLLPENPLAPENGDCASMSCCSQCNSCLKCDRAACVR